LNKKKFTQELYHSELVISSIIQINIEKYNSGFGFAHSKMHIYALGRDLPKNKVIINGPINSNHRAIGLHPINVSINSDTKFLLPLQQVGLKIHQAEI
jgi:hypothetical protein